jgi:hypothetical protein
MSQRAIEYVLNLGSDRVTVAQKLVLLAIAEHHSDRHGTADVAIGDLGDDAIRSPRQLRRIFKKLEHLIEYRPGVGSGNYSQFRFVELVTKGTERGHKGDICATAIRKDLNPVQNQNQNPPNPLSSKGGTFGKRLITVRQVRELRNQIDAAEKDGLPRLAAIEQACRRMLFPVDAAIDIFEAAGHQETSKDLRTLVEENPRKQPRKVSAA